VRDQRGTTLPVDAATGQLDWQWTGGAVLIGQLSQSTPTQHSVSPMYARRCCCTEAAEVTFWIEPGSQTRAIGESYSFTAWEHDQDCNGDDIRSEYNPFGVQWSLYPLIASINYSGGGTCYDAGTALVTGRLSVLMGQSTWGDYECSCDNYPQAYEAYATLNVQPSISGPTHTVWWFNGQNPNSSIYPVSVTLTSSGGSPTSWSISSGSSEVQLSTNSGAQTTVTSTGTAFSGSPNDIAIVATAGGMPSGAFHMTAKKPGSLVFNSFYSGTEQESSTGYSTTIAYDLYDSLNVKMETDVGWNEALGTAQCENGSNWCQFTVYSQNGSTNPVVDILAPPSNPNRIPTPVYNNLPTGTTRYRAIPQTQRVGSTTSGNGVIIKTDTLGYYIDHGSHDQ
jgi:hypothetical protein